MGFILFIIILFVIWFAWGVLKHMARARYIVNLLTNTRISVLKNPSIFLEDFESDLDLDKAKPYEVKEYISKALISSLTMECFNVSDFIPSNIEVTKIFFDTVNDIYDTMMEEFNNRQNHQYFDIDDEVPF